MPPTNNEHPAKGSRSHPALAETLPGNAPPDPRAATVLPPATPEQALGATLPGTVRAPHSAAELASTLPPDSLPSAAAAPKISVTHGLTATYSEFPVANWDHYEFLQRLGRGGMGAVYKARDKRLHRTMALKFIRGADPNLVMRFMQEARAQARIDHPQVCKVYEIGEVQGHAYIAMQYVDGKSLDSSSLQLSLTQKVVLRRKVAEAMHEAHKLGIIHRDLKPANIMLEREIDGTLNPVVMDFGLARESGENQGLTETGAVMGTPAYMAPEQARGETRLIDRRSDVYSLGATLYDLIVGIPLFDAESVMDILLKVISDDAKPLRTAVPSVPPDLETIVMKCLNKEPNQRYDSAKLLAEDLGRYIDGEPILGRRVSLGYRLRRLAQRHRTLVAVSAVFLVVLIGIVGSNIRQYFASQRERARVAAQAQLERELTQQIKDLEWFLRTAYQLPLHDIGEEQALVRQRMAALPTPSAAAFYRKEYDQALTKARQAQSRTRWWYGARQFEGDVLLARGTEEKDQGKYEEAARNVQAAIDAYGIASDIGRSDASIYESTAEAFIKQAEIAVNFGKPQEQAIAAATDSDVTQVAEKALSEILTCRALNPHEPETHIMEARLLLIRAKWIERHGGKPIPAALAAMAAAVKAAELNPDADEAALQKAHAAFLLARQLPEGARGPRLSEGLSAIEQGIKVKADSGPQLAIRAVLLHALDLAHQNAPGRTDLPQRAEASWRQALLINPLLEREYGPYLRDPWR